jgi:uncharacterized protein
LSLKTQLVYLQDQIKSYYTREREWKNMQTNKGRGRGFASMSPEKKREIASKGGKAAHAMGTAHKWTSEEAQAAGRKGGSISRRRPKSPTQQAQA